METQPILSTKNIETFYGPIKALRGISLNIQPGAITTIIGANGAGKSTILKTLSGALSPQKGTITWQGKSIAGIVPDKVSRMGIAHVPEGREVFPLLSVKENLILGGFAVKDSSATFEQVLQYFPILAEKLDVAAGLLSGGQQQMLALGRALMQKPKIMLLDEPSLGLAPVLTQEIFAVLKRLNQETQLTMIIVEQNAKLALEICDHGYVLELGRIVLEGTRAELLDNQDIQEFYLGGRNQGIRGRKRWKKRKTWS